MAIKRLNEHGHGVEAVGRNEGEIDGVQVQTKLPGILDHDTVTVYLNPLHQEQYQEALRSMRPKRVIFNPGAENPEFEQELRDAGVEVLEACTLVMLSTDQF